MILKLDTLTFLFHLDFNNVMKVLSVGNQGQSVKRSKAVFLAAITGIKTVTSVFQGRISNHNSQQAGEQCNQGHTGETLWWMNHRLVSLVKAADSWNSVYYLWLREQHKDSQPLSSSWIRDKADGGWRRRFERTTGCRRDCNARMLHVCCPSLKGSKLPFCLDEIRIKQVDGPAGSG